MNDDRSIVHGAHFADLNRIPAVFGLRSMAVVGQSAEAAVVDSYRPMSMASLMLNTAVSREPFGFQLTNLALHVLVTMLVFFIALRTLGPAPGGPALAALFFGLSPAAGEAHVWINGRSDPLAALFTAAAMIVLLRATSNPGDRAKPSWSAGFLILCACFSKEVVLMMLPPLLLVACGFAEDGRLSLARLKGGAIRMIPSAGAAIGYLAARLVVLRGMSAGRRGEMLESVRYLPALVGDAVRAFAIPTRVGMRTIQDDYDLAGRWEIAAATLLGLAFFALAFRMRRRAPMFALGAATLACALVPITVFVKYPWIGFGRYLYLPAMVLAPGVMQLAASIRPTAFITTRSLAVLGRATTACALLLDGSFAVIQCRDYKNAESFYTAAMRDWPAGRYGYLGLGQVNAMAGDYENAIVLLARTAKAAPPDWAAEYYLAHSYLGTGDAERALRTVETAREDAFHRHWYAFVEAAATRIGDPRRASMALQRCLGIMPHFAPCNDLNAFLECRARGSAGCAWALPRPPDTWDLEADGPPRTPNSRPAKPPPPTRIRSRSSP